MNANDIWKGHEYAYLENRPNNIDAPSNADKVRAIRVVKRLEPGNKRETTFVVAEILERNNSSWPYYKVGEKTELRARYFIDFWSDYRHRREEIEKERFEHEEAARIKSAARQERINAARAEQERIAAEKRLARVKERLLITEAFAEKTGIPKDWVVIENGIIGVQDTTPIRLWLSVPMGDS